LRRFSDSFSIPFNSRIWESGRWVELEGQRFKSVFGSVVAGAFQITFRAEIHANDVFLFFKNHF